MKSQNILLKNFTRVDIDEIAVEITKLRLWLKLIISSEEKYILPVLNSNIQKGDSLSNIELPKELGLIESQENLNQPI